MFFLVVTKRPSEIHPAGPRCESLLSRSGQSEAWQENFQFLAIGPNDCHAPPRILAEQHVKLIIKVQGVADEFGVTLVGRLAKALQTLPASWPNVQVEACRFCFAAGLHLFCPAGARVSQNPP